MRKVIYSKFDKQKIGALPKAIFDGRVFVVQSESEARRAVDYLLSRDILGFDTETRPAFKKGVSHKVGLLQVATREECFLFRLNFTGLTPDILRLLQDNTILKIGLSWHDDLRMLHQRAPFQPGKFVELQDLVGRIGIKDMSLQKLYANLFHQKISKSQRLTNWDADVLKESQKRYAATDAWACIRIYEETERLMKTGDYELVVVPEPEPQPAHAGDTPEETKQ